MDWSRYQADLERLNGRRRVWIVFCYKRQGYSVSERDYLLYLLDHSGRREHSYVVEGAAAYLYDLSSPRPMPAQSPPAR